MRIPFALLLLSSTALAGPFPETLPRADLDAIVTAIQANLPPVDKAAAAKCQPLMDEYNKAPEQNAEKVFDAASCYRAAGSLGAAIQMFKLYERYGKDAARKKETLRALAASLETAAMFSEAAATGERYAKTYGGEKDAKERLVRAICIRRQLGDAREATSNGKYLERTFKTKADDTLCATIRPIAKPASGKP